MAIHPIDLQAVFSQLDNVAKFGANQNQNADMAGMINISQNVKNDMEKASSVQKTPEDNKTDSTKIKDNNSKNSENQSSSRKDSQEEEPEKKRQIEITDPRLGNHIDVTG